jgi:hypothetical protein
LFGRLAASRGVDLNHRSAKLDPDANWADRIVVVDWTRIYVSRSERIRGGEGRMARTLDSGPLDITDRIPSKRRRP